jgi:hypothetical protein
MAVASSSIEKMADSHSQDAPLKFGESELEAADRERGLRVAARSVVSAIVL